MKRRIAASVMTISLAVSLYSSSAVRAYSDSPRVLKLATTKQTASYMYDGIELFKELVEEYTEGALIIEIYPDSQLGGQNEMFQGMTMGTIELGFLPTAAADSLFPKSATMGALFSAGDEEHALAIWNSEPSRAILEEQASAINVRELSFVIDGTRNIWTSTPVNSLKDLNGIRLRIPEVPLFIDFFEAIGVDPIQMDITEVYAGIQTGIVDGLEYDSYGILDFSFNDLCLYCYETKHGVAVDAFMAAENIWQSLTDEEREAVTSAAEAASEYLNTEYYTSLENSRKILESSGVVFTEVSAEDTRAIEESTSHVIDAYFSEVGTSEELLAFRKIGQ